MSSTFSTLSLSTLTAPTPTQSPTSFPTNPNTSQNNSSSQNYLFFIALALGVVFANLWIILGVRYLYRRRQRQRNLALDPESAHPGTMIPMIARGMVVHPLSLGRHNRPRRKREKKVVSLAYMDDNFPVTLYGDWKHGPLDSATEKSEKSEKSEKVVDTILEKDLDALSDDVQEDFTHTTIIVEDHDHVALSLSNSEDASALSLSETNSRNSRVEPADPDTCAICIEQLENCDEVRILKCNHVYHLACITPWMTNRNASCPLCKTSYYVPPAPPLPTWLANNGQGTIPPLSVPEATRSNPAEQGATDSAPRLPTEMPAAARLNSRFSRFKRAIRLP